LIRERRDHAQWKGLLRSTASGGLGWDWQAKKKGSNINNKKEVMKGKGGSGW